MIKCQFCGSHVYKKTLNVKSEISDCVISYSVCSRCNSIIQNNYPDPQTLHDYYENYNKIKEIMNPGYLSDDNLKPFFEERYKTLSEIGFNIENIKNSVNIELGCANGHFLRFLSINGSSETIGIDVSQSLLDRINIDNVTTIRGSLSDIEDSHADNLYLFNVLEHVADLDNLFYHINRVTSPSANIIIEVPLSGIISDSFGGEWRFLMPDEHLNIPSIKGLLKITGRYNLKICGSTRFGSGYTSGMINKRLKSFLDKTAKLFRYGDRGAFLLRKTN